MKHLFMAVAKTDEEDWNEGDSWFISETEYSRKEAKDIYIDGEYYDRCLFQFCRYTLDDETSKASE